MNGVLCWPCPRASCTTTQVIPVSERRHALVTRNACPCLDPLPQKELNAALEDTLSSPQTIHEGTSYCSMPVKTPITHPLNISFILPPELLPAISSHLIANPEPSPTYLIFTPSTVSRTKPSTSHQQQTLPL
ncbi:hypothetical protein BDR07DRAFT_565204 [Suillus spraguei]|nr:hypothetical protein BDR07DRAFT_565204 [Suillus spraguei]